MPFHTQTKKYAGLSRLHDVAAEASGVEFYPVKRQPWDTRKLNPNWDGIHWLESDANGFDDDTKIDYTENVGEEGYPELVYLYAIGRLDKSYPRPMFQILPRDAFHTSGQRIEKPCPDCWDFHRSWGCEEHGERDYDHERHCFLSPQVLEQDERERSRVRNEATLTFHRNPDGTIEPGPSPRSNAFASDSWWPSSSNRYCPCGCGALNPRELGGPDLGYEAIAEYQRQMQRINTRFQEIRPYQPGTITANGLHHSAAVSPVLGTSNWTITVEAETEQYRGSGIAEVFTIEVERPGGQ